MQQIKDLERINLTELESGVPLESSWHAQYKASNYVYVGGLPYNLTEGDLEVMMSQFGAITDLNLVRNEDTNESKGFGFVQYADWRSTVLAVDNFNGTELMRRRLRVDHVLDYKRRDDEGETWWELKQKDARKKEKKALKKDKKKSEKKALKKEKKKRDRDISPSKRARSDDQGGIMLRGQGDTKLIKREDGSFAIAKE